MSQQLPKYTTILPKSQQNFIQKKRAPSAKFKSLKLVPGTGLEPAHLAVYAPKAYVSANSTIRAYPNYNIKFQRSEIFSPTLTNLNFSLGQSPRGKVGYEHASYQC